MSACGWTLFQLHFSKTKGWKVRTQDPGDLGWEEGTAGVQSMLCVLAGLKATRRLFVKNHRGAQQHFTMQECCVRAHTPTENSCFCDCITCVLLCLSICGCNCLRVHACTCTYESVSVFPSMSLYLWICNCAQVYVTIYIRATVSKSMRLYLFL